MRKTRKLFSKKPLFWEPPVNTSAVIVLEELREYVAKLGYKKIRKGAEEINILEWLKRHHHADFIELNGSPEAKQSPVLFSENLNDSEKPTELIELLFTPVHIYRVHVNKPVGDIAVAQLIVNLSVVSKTELHKFGMMRKDLGQDLALSLECMLWRITHNPKDFSTPP